jgi:hypothetical protein
MAQLTDTVLSELLDFFCWPRFEDDPVPDFKDWYVNVSPSEAELAKDLQGEWATLTETERRIFESPQNYCNVLAEWRRPSS